MSALMKEGACNLRNYIYKRLNENKINAQVDKEMIRMNFNDNKLNSIFFYCADNCFCVLKN